MNVSVVVATYGAEEWPRLARTRAIPSAESARPAETTHLHVPDGTLAQARNGAAAIARGDWLCFLDADDELEPGYLDAMANAFMLGAITTDWAPLLVPAVRYIHPPFDVSTASGPRPIRGYVSPAGIPQKGRWPELNECVVGTLVRRSLFERVGGFREATSAGTPLSSLEDYDLWLRCFDAGAQLVYVEDAVYRAYVNPRGRNLDQSPYDAIWADHLERAAK